MKKLIRKLILATFLLLFCTTFVSAEVFYVDTDAYGTPVAVSKSDGTTVWESDYYPFGELYRNINNQKPNNRRLIGKEKDQETGLTYFGARYHDEALARFGSVDPIGPVDPWTSQTDYAYLTNPQRLNRYVYGMNNPYRYVDPDGRVSVGQLETGNLGSYGGENTLESMYERSGFFERDFDSISYGYDFVDIEMTLGAIDPPGSIGAKFFNKASRISNALAKQADDLVPLNNGKNRVTLKSPSQKMEVDLKGKPHAGVPTPHTKISPRNPNAPKQPAYNTKNSSVIEATQQDLRTIRRYLERQSR